MLSCVAACFNGCPSPRAAPWALNWVCVALFCVFSVRSLGDAITTRNIWSLRLTFSVHQEHLNQLEAILYFGHSSCASCFSCTWRNIIARRHPCQPFLVQGTLEPVPACFTRGAWESSVFIPMSIWRGGMKGRCKGPRNCHCFLHLLPRGQWAQLMASWYLKPGRSWSISIFTRSLTFRRAVVA